MISLVESFLSSGLMVKEESKYRMLSWEVQNANLIKNRQNGRKGGRPASKAEPSSATVDNIPNFGTTAPADITDCPF